MFRTAGSGGIRTCSDINNPCVDKTLSKILCALGTDCAERKIPRRRRVQESFCKMEKKQNMTCTDSLDMYAAAVLSWYMSRRVGKGFLSCHAVCAPHGKCVFARTDDSPPSQSQAYAGLPH